ncbi:MAG: hypothetical protein AAF526_10610, partial [Pseudomonadota bacterium]
NWKEMIFGPGVDNANQMEESESEPQATNWREMIFGPGTGDTDAGSESSEAKTSWREAIFGPGVDSKA